MNARIATAAIAFSLLGAAIRPAVDILPTPFLASLTPEARAELDEVAALYVPLLQHPIAFYFQPLHVIVYGPNETPSGMRHEAMHAIDPCHFNLACERAFASQLPADLRKTAEDLYGPIRWSEAEYWPVLPAWYLWNPDEMPHEIRLLYSTVFH